jgi:kumamolisin
LVLGDNKVSLPSSERAPWPGAQKVGPVRTDAVVRVTVVLRRRSGGDLPSGGNIRLSRGAFADAHGADGADVEMLLDLARRHGLQVEKQSLGRRALVLAGPAGAMQEAFGTELAMYRTRHGQFRGRTGPVMVPAALGTRILAVLGLDNRRAARSRARTVDAAGPGFTPLELAGLYEFPSGLDGSGQTIGIVALGGGYLASDMKEYFAGMGLNAPEIVDFPVNGGQNQPGVDEVADRETTLDIQVAGAIAPGARIVVYFTENSEEGLHDALSAAVHDSVHAPTVISLSWGGPEETWTSQLRSALSGVLDDAAAIAVTVTAAAGDDGAADGVPLGLHVDLPACLPGVLGCGGTRIEVAGGQLTESVWNDAAAGLGATGGGVSRFIPLPAWQSTAGVPAHPQTGFRGRGVPDVAANADPNTGYRVRINGVDQAVGGTSAAAPLWAGLIARINQGHGRPVGFVNPLLYSAGKEAFRDVVVGGNQGCLAGVNWDACTGLGSPRGETLASALPGAVRTAGANTTGTAPPPGPATA